MMLSINLQVEETKYNSLISFLKTLQYVKIEHIETLPKLKKQRNFGCMKGMVLYMAADFNAPLEEFNEYMQ